MPKIEANIIKGAVTISKSVSAQMSNRPIYSCGRTELAGYVSIHLYDAYNALGTVGGSAELYSGTALLTGYVDSFVETVGLS